MVTNTYRYALKQSCSSQCSWRWWHPSDGGSKACLCNNSCCRSYITEHVAFPILLFAQLIMTIKELNWSEHLRIKTRVWTCKYSSCQCGMMVLKWSKILSTRAHWIRINQTMDEAKLNCTLGIFVQIFLDNAFWRILLVAGNGLSEAACHPCGLPW